MAKKKAKGKADEEALANNELEVITAAPHTLKTKKGKEYKLYPLDVATMAELRIWAKTRVTDELHDTLKHLGKDAPKAIIERAWEDAYKELRDPLVSAAIETPEAIQHWILISIKKGDETITDEIVAELIKDHGIKELFVILMSLNGITEETLANPQVAKLLADRRLGR